MNATGPTNLARLADRLGAPDAAASGRDVERVMAEMGRRARAAAHRLALAAEGEKNAALRAMAARIRAAAPAILAANADDVAEAKSRGQAPAFLDRLMLDDGRRRGDRRGRRERRRCCPIRSAGVLAAFERPNGLVIERVATPLGVIGVIFESRPNVTADAGALCLKAGNAAILRAGSDSFRSASAIAAAMRHGLAEAGLPADAIQLVPTRDRAAVGAMLTGLDGDLDVIVPRGGKSLVARVQAEARVPVFAHLEGVCHVYVHAAADLDMAKRIVLNAKMRRTGVCGAAETLLVDRACAATHLGPLVDDAARRRLRRARRRRRRRRPTRASRRRPRRIGAPNISTRSSPPGWSTVSTRRSRHIETYGSHHTDAIVTDDAEAAERFLAEVDSAIVLHNASTQFADGGEFGFGAEIGIATGRMHARGPVGVEQLTSFKYRVRGAGQTRP